MENETQISSKDVEDPKHWSVISEPHKFLCHQLFLWKFSCSVITASSSKGYVELISDDIYFTKIE